MATLTSYEGSNNDLQNFGVTTTAGQSFQVTAGTASQIAFWGCAGLSASGTFKFEIKTTSVTGTVIATTGTLTTTSTLTAYNPTPVWQTLNLVTPVALSAATTYYLVGTAVSGSSTDEVRWSVDTAGTYPSGQFYDGTTPAGTADRNFRILSASSQTTEGLRIQDKFNILAGTTGRSIIDCLNIINGASDVSEQDAYNRWAGTTGLRKQDCANIKAGTTGLRIQDCLNLL